MAETKAVKPALKDVKISLIVEPINTLDKGPVLLDITKPYLEQVEDMSINSITANSISNRICGVMVESANGDWGTTQPLHSEIALDRIRYQVSNLIDLAIVNQKQADKFHETLDEFISGIKSEVWRTISRAKDPMGKPIDMERPAQG